MAAVSSLVQFRACANLAHVMQTGGYPAGRPDVMLSAEAAVAILHI